MDEFQPSVGARILAFARRGAFAGSLNACFTARDRMEVFAWQETASAAGYDRMVIHDRDTGDAQEVGNFLSVYRRGESWSRWGFARQGQAISGWCCLTSMDMGQFDTLADAFATVLKAARPSCSGAMLLRAAHGSAVVTELAARRVRSLGSAA